MESVTHQLNLRDMFFPPHRCFQFWSIRRHKVIAIHDHVNECIDDTEQSAMAT